MSVDFKVFLPIEVIYLEIGLCAFDALSGQPDLLLFLFVVNTLLQCLHKKIRCFIQIGLYPRGR